MIFPRVIDRSIPVIMRGSFIAVVITLLSLQMVKSSTGNAQGILDKKRSVSVSEAPMVQVLEHIHGQTGVEFIYSSKAQLRQKVSLNIEKERLEITLDRLLDPVGLTYEVVGQNIVITRRNRRVGLIPLDLPAVKLQNLHLLLSAVQDSVITGRIRSDARRAGREFVSPFRSRWSRDHETKQIRTSNTSEES